MHFVSHPSVLSFVIVLVDWVGMVMEALCWLAVGDVMSEWVVMIVIYTLAVSSLVNTHAVSSCFVSHEL